MGQEPGGLCRGSGGSDAARHIGIGCLAWLELYVARAGCWFCGHLCHHGLWQFHVSLLPHADSPDAAWLSDLFQPVIRGGLFASGDVAGGASRDGGDSDTCCYRTGAADLLQYALALDILYPALYRLWCSFLLCCHITGISTSHAACARDSGRGGERIKCRGVIDHALIQVMPLRSNHRSDNKSKERSYTGALLT